MIRFLLKKNPYFGIPFEIYLILGGFFIVFTQKGDLVLWFNTLHNPVLDQIMVVFTLGGSGLLGVLCILILLFYRFYHSLLLAVTFGLTVGLVTLLKHTLFTNFDRPLKYFGENSGLHLVEGVTVHSYNSFPSGHSAEAFAVLAMLSFLVKNQKLGLFFFFLALIISLSRPYLVQHFFMDTYAGAGIGVMISSLVFYFFEKKTNLKEKDFWNRKLGQRKELLEK